MFWLIDLFDKKAKVYCIMNDTYKEILHPLVKNNVYAPGILNGNNELDIQIFSDCFSVYNVRDFDNMGFILKKVKHSVWFAQG